MKPSCSSFELPHQVRGADEIRTRIRWRVSVPGRSGDRRRMLRLERESEIDRGCLCHVGLPRPAVGLLCRGKDSNLHCHRFFRLNFSVSLRS